MKHNLPMTLIGLVALSLSIFLILDLSFMLSIQIPQHSILFLIALPLGIILADLASGIAHWVGDTWGKETTPLFGKTFIRPFREHHEDQTKICEHSFIETNDNNGIITLPFLILALYISSFNTPISFFISSTMLITTTFVLFTNQIHKWAHAKKVNIIIKSLQQIGIILSPKHHKVHHTKPHTEYYAITNGWTNKLFKKIKLYRTLECFGHKLTKAIPRDY